jgi:hypothetical protein
MGQNEPCIRSQRMFSQNGPIDRVGDGANIINLFFEGSFSA